jgi:hypothetical protein
MEKYYRALCSSCGSLNKASDDRRFLSPFFLPRRCVGCDKHMTSNADWVIEYGYMKRMVEFNLFKPCTWFSGYIWTVIK